MFEKTLTDMVKGIRTHKKDEAKYIANCMRECKDELTKQNDIEIKAEALLKLTYLQMHGHPMTWAAFNCVEAMSSPIFRAKRLGYLGATQTFSPETDVVLLATNLIKKDMSSPNAYEAVLALNALANIVTPELSRDLVADVVSKLASPTAYVRKRAVLLLYKCILKYPDALRPAFPKLKEKLTDSDPSVVGTAVNVICELARKNPRNFLSLAPTFFTILTTTSNNWMLIKITKLFGSLTPLEPRLGKKLVQPLTNILNTTQAKSLMYEVVSTVSLGLTQHDGIVELGMQKLQGFLEDKDQNLKYLALLCMGRFILTHPALVATHQATIVRCLDDVDETIRMRALDLVTGMVSANNIRDVVKLLLAKASKAKGGVFVQPVVEKVLSACSSDGYAHLKTQEDFEWYLETLGAIARLPGITDGETLAAQLSDVPLRVAEVRSFAAQTMVALLDDVDVLMEGRLADDETAAQIIAAASWVVSEYCGYLKDYAGVVAAMLQPTVVAIPVAQQPVYLHALLKVCGKAAGDGQADLPVTLKAATGSSENASEAAAEGDAAVEEARAAQEARLSALGAAELEPEPEAEPAPTGKPLATLVLDTLRGFTTSTNAEVQERACFGVALLESYDLASEGAQLASLFEEELKPVGRTAQAKMAAETEIDLDTAIFTESDLEPDLEAEDEEAWDFMSDRKGSSRKKRSGSSRAAKAADDEEAYRREHTDGAFYLGGGGGDPAAGGRSSPSPEGGAGLRLGEEAAANDDEEEEEGGGPLFALDEKFKKKRKGKRSHGGHDSEASAGGSRSVSVLRSEADDGVPASGTGPADALSIQNLDNIGADEVLPETKAYERATATYSGLRSGAAGGGGGAGMDWMAEEAAREKKRKHKSSKSKKSSRDEDGERKHKSSKSSKKSSGGGSEKKHSKSGKSSKSSGKKSSKKSGHDADAGADAEAIPDIAPAATVEAWGTTEQPAAVEPAVAGAAGAGAGDEAKKEKKKKKKSKAKE